MSEITVEKTHALLEKLSEYVINEVPTKREMNARFEQVEAKMNFHFECVEADIHETREKIENLDLKVNGLMDGMDSQAKQLDIIRTEQTAFSSAFDRHEKRITALENPEQGYRIKDKGAKLK